MSTAQLLILAALSGASLAWGCAASEAAPEKVVRQPPMDAARLLSRCERLENDPDVTSWSCGKLTVVQTMVEAASEREVAMAFDGFAASFGAGDARRVDSTYVRGGHAAMRLEGKGPRGEPIEAQMVAVAVGNGVRLVTCSTKDAWTPCAPVVAHLVQHSP